MSAPRIVTPQEAQSWIDNGRQMMDHADFARLAHTVAMEPKRFRWAFFRTLRAESERSPSQEVCDYLDSWSDAIDNGEDW